MSRDSLERVLWTLCVDRSAKARFREDAAAYLERFALSAEETRMVVAFDVKGLQGYGVSPLLTMGFWSVLAPDRNMALYNQRLGGTSAHSASIRGDGT
jgi:protocatechuate 4,5-dioxygenase alpha chain